MSYRARNIRTQAIVLEGESFIAENDDPEWVLEFECGDEWMPSGYHLRDINGVKDPRPFSEIAEALKEIPQV